jgi:hypothetical protein
MKLPVSAVCVSLLVAGLVQAQTQSDRGPPRRTQGEIAVTPIVFQKSNDLSAKLRDFYSDELEGYRELDLPPPDFFIGSADLNGDGFREVVVRVYGSLSCSAAGQCRTDVLDLASDGPPKILLSIVAVNVGYFSPMAVAGANRQPARLLVNIPEFDFRDAQPARPRIVNPISSASEWLWDGSKYALVAGGVR